MRNAIRAIRRWKASHGDVERVAERKVCSLEAAISYLCNATLDKDTGFQGYEPEGVISRQPKKLKGKALSIGDKFLNRIFSSARVEVEHVISGTRPMPPHVGQGAPSRHPLPRQALQRCSPVPSTPAGP